MTLKIAYFTALGAFAFSILFLPVRSPRDGSLADISVYLGGEGESPGVFYDRDFDFPTGYCALDLPVWLVDFALLSLSAWLRLAMSGNSKGGLAKASC